MSSIVIFCRRFSALMQAAYPHSVRLRALCQDVDVSRGAVAAVPSDTSISAGGDTAVVKNQSTSANLYSEDDAAKIVRLINTFSETTALKRVSANITARIASYRAAHGPFVSVSDLLRVPGVGQQTLQRICREILQPSLQVEVGGKNGSPLGAEQVGVSLSRIESLKDVVAVDIGMRYLGWVYMTRDRRVWQWKVKDLVGITAGKWDPPAYHRVIANAISEMPKPDFYVLEHQSYASANKATYQTLLFQRTLQSMLYATLNSDAASDTGTPRAISLPQAQVGRHFDLQVRGMRASGQDVVAKLLRDGAEVEDDADLPARVNWEGAEVFHAASKHQREHLSNCLLQAIAFYDLIVGQKG